MTAVFVIDILCASLLIPGKRNIFYKWKLVENLRNDNISISQNIDYWLKRLIIDYRSMITYLVIILLVIYVSGRSDALGQDYHYVVNTKPERVVLWMTEDYSICSLYGKQTHIVDPNYIILKNGDDTSIEFTLEKTGRLQPSGNIFSFTILGD
jgi:hypothetical protein